LNATRKPVKGHPGITERTWTDKAGRVQHRYDASYRGLDRREHSQAFTLLGRADTWLRNQRRAVERHEWLDPSQGLELFEEFWGRWLADAGDLGRPSERTLIAYVELWRLYIGPRLGRCPLSTITRADVLDLVQSAAERSAWRAHDVLKVVRMLLNRAVDEERILRNPAARVPVPRIEQAEPWVLTPEEVESLADAVPERARALVLLAAYSSLRWSELVALRVDRLDLPRRRVRVEEKITEYGKLIHGEPKTRQSRRAVAIPEFVAFELAEHLRRFPAGPDGLVFAAPEGGPLRRPHFGRQWRKSTAAAGLDGFRFGNLRHTGASLAIAAGANPLLVAARLGHTSTRMVERHYVSLFEGLDREIGDQLGAMREDREEVSKRLRPEAGAGSTRDRAGSVLPLEGRRRAGKAI
jgi:integrase